MDDLGIQIEQAVQTIRKKWNRDACIGLILGTGLGTFVDHIEDAVTIPFSDIPHFCKSTALGHVGQLVCGQLENTPVIAMQGRFHFYEGYTLQQITFPVRVFKAMGISLLIVTSASGGMNPQHQPGQLIVIDDHINLMGDNPLAGFNDDSLGPRYPDMSQPYDAELIEKALQLARKQNIPAQRGVYVGVKGPNYETRAEYRFFRTIGGDVVGMSTVPETLVAVHSGLRVLGLSTVTNVCLPDALQPVTGEDVIEVANRASRDMTTIIRGIIKEESPSQTNR
ncbi:MAG: purine-nucleoside phosphorylase [Planctomycetaceae bacterium]|nr:purine-nucleoside phosphorylase [Planctomycetaceae bacterium]